MIYNILYKTLFGTKPLRIRFDEIDGLITGYDRSRYLVLFGAVNYDAIYNKIRYLVSLKNGITYVFPYYYAKLKVDSFDSLTREKVLTLQNYIIYIKPVLNKGHNHYNYNTLFGKSVYQSARK